MFQLATVSRAGDYPKSTLAITFVSRRPGDPGLASPVLFVVGGWMYGVGQRLEAGRGGEGAGGLLEKLGEALAIPLATVSRAGDYPRSTFTITLVSRRPGDPGLASPVLFVVGGGMYGVGRRMVAKRGGRGAGDYGDIG